MERRAAQDALDAARTLCGETAAPPELRAAFCAGPVSARGLTTRPPCAGLSDIGRKRSGTERACGSASD